ncbi:MAG: glycine cleavage system aminomethyltransferase GcvT [Verrucomicrobia bacterium]|nr:MAG: glycine cleavage system aminomethyltransferase GcvT [Verrucomicrobiota bacterium]
MLKRTPLFEAHQKLGGKLIEFGGWEMPVQYTSIMDEHQAVRTAAGLFDISHMGEVVVSGPQAEAFLNQTLTNDVRELTAGRGQYTLMCNERGGVIDDLYIFRLMRTEFLLIINASRINQDVEWMTQRVASGPYVSDVKVTNASNRFGAVAVQGPRVKEFINGCIVGSSAGPTEVDQASDLQKNELGLFNFNRMVIYVARTGYTGEDGFEIFAPLQIVAIWNKLLEVGRPFGLKPCGLGARDTLRTEMCYPLYGQELDEQTTPIEAGLGFFVALGKGDFVGRTVLAEQKEKGVSKKCVAFKMTDKSAPPRPHYAIWSTGADAKHIGEVVSGTQSPSLGIGIGMGYVPAQFAKPGTALEIEIRGKRAPAVVVQKPIYRKPTRG